MLRLNWFASLITGCCLLGVGAADCAAADKNKDPLERPSRDTSDVYTSPGEADADFQFVGEYVGFEWTTGLAQSSRAISIQINAVGDGQFVATKMFGGTPDTFATSRKPVALEGTRIGSRVELEGERFRYLVDGQFGYVVNDENIIIGKLKRSARISPTMGRPVPAGAVVLFGGEETNELVNARLTEDGDLKAGTQTTNVWGDFQMHLEFKLPYKPAAFGQHRGNSGVYIQSRYELQILDSFGWVPAFNDCSSLYRTKRPDRNATLPPLTWQTYDIDFAAARFDAAGNKVEPARITAWLNGIKIHDNFAIPNKTGAGQKEGPKPLPIKLQDHKNPVVFRNAWILGERDRSPEFSLPSPVPQEPTPVSLPPVAAAIVQPSPLGTVFD